MENRHRTYQRQSMGLVFFLFALVLLTLLGRLFYLMIGKADYYGVQAKELHERERKIKAERGEIKDCHGNVLAANRSVSTISVIHSQMKEPERVITLLSKELMLDEKEVRKKVEKVSLREKIKSNVDKETSDRIRNYKLAGVTVDEDYKREYRYDSLASKVLGFTGGDNQGIIGLEVSYEKYLKGLDGSILTMTTAYGTEIENGAEDRIEPVAGWTLNTSLDLPVMEYTDQLANYLLKKKQAKSVDIIVMNPQNGEIYAMASAPEFNLNDPYRIPGDLNKMSAKEKSEKRNAMWRNPCVSDTYEPGSTFKILTTAAALEKGVVKMTDRFHCPGYKIVEDRRIRCHKKGGHGSETFLDGIMNSCNPVFIEVGARVGVSDFFRKMSDFGLMNRTGIDVPGEASTIIHKEKNVGAVELATMSFGQSFQLSPIRLVSIAGSMINGGYSITPHFGVSAVSADGSLMKHFSYGKKERVVAKETSDLIRMALGKVVSEGTGHKASVKGFSVGAKTGTSEKLPRGNGKYIASTIGFAPVENPKVIALVRIDEPQGLYYGGTVAAPAIAALFENILPYLCKN
ncbi:MAG: peptidoglycan glycosyltransferase [Clostridium sp.]|nr:peptidoglycan glycosyltransferase [Clostridium sp.]MDY4875542.1 penicillin-binding transpeptidase domain-containing protein [Eubacterium sp.]